MRQSIIGLHQDYLSPVVALTLTRGGRLALLVLVTPTPPGAEFD